MAKKRRKGRGRLSNIEQLPPECAPIIVWASDELRKRERTQTEIYKDFYDQLDAVRREHRGELEFDIPSRTAFNRHSLMLAEVSQRMDTTREIAGALADSFDAEASDDLTVIAAEAIKTLIFEILTSSGEAGVDPKGAMQLASALRSAAQAQGVSTARRQKVETEFAGKVDEALESVRKVKGLTAETAEAIKTQILGRPAA